MHKSVIILVSLLVLAGCSSTFAYNNIDWLVYWYIDDYIDLTEEQEQQFDTKMSSWLKWHRDTELRLYETHINQIRHRALTTAMSPEDILDELSIARQHWLRLRDEVAPGLAQMAPLLSDEQVIYLFAQLERENQKQQDERLDELKDTSEKQRFDNQIKQITSQVEDYIGKTTSQQRQLIRTYVPQLQSTDNYWLAYRRKTQQVARELFASRGNNPEFVEQLTQLIKNPDGHRSSEHNRVSNQNSLIYATMLSELQASMSDKQRRRLNKKIDQFVDDLEDLIDA